MDRRTMLKGSLVLTATGHTVVSNRDIVENAHSSRMATSDAPADVVRHHAARIIEAMNLIRPDKSYRFHLNTTEGYIHITGDKIA